MARRGISALAATCAVLLAALGAQGATPPADESVLAQMTQGSADGWWVAMLNGLPAKGIHVSADGSGVAASDTPGMSSSWYFVAPPAFSGDLKAAYNGKLSFSVVTMAVADAKATKDLRDPLVVLQATCGHYLYYTPSKVASGATSVMLNEDAGWKDSRTGKRAGVLDMLGVLSHLSHIKIRGGFFKTSAETTRLVALTLVAGGRSWFPCCTLTNEVDMCAKKPTDWFSPSNLVFYCEGSLRKTIKVNRIYPRFARRTGGASITVEGQNFGLSGSQPIVRIGGRKCETTRYAASSHTTVDRERPNNKNGNALLSAWDDATDSMKSMYPEHCWNGMKDDGTDTGYNYGTDAAPKYINQGETGIDTGGPCFPSHCSSCPDDNKGWCAGGQILAVSSGACKGRGNADKACHVQFPYQHYPNLCPDNAEPALSATIISRMSSTTVASDTTRIHSPSLTASQRAFDLMDRRYTTTSIVVGAADATITVAAPTDLVCQHHNDASARNCTAPAGIQTDLVENYLKIVNVAAAPGKATVEWQSEVVKVLQVSSAGVLTVQRGQGGTTARAFPIGALVHMCGKHAHCLVHSDLKRGRFIKVNNEIMAVESAGAIGHVAISAASCGSGYIGTGEHKKLQVSCAAPCNFTTPMAGYITVVGNAITGVTVTDGGSGYHPDHLPTITALNGTGCSFTPYWNSVRVSRGAARTQAVAHTNAPVTVSRMDCIDNDETGDNCGGTCKPCPSNVMGPSQQDKVVCKVPEAVRGESTRNLAVTVEAAPGPKHSPYSVRMDPTLKGWSDASVAAVSCISEQSRGFAYGAHDFQWATSLRTSAGSVHTTSLSVDPNSGETYITGTMQGPLTIRGKHIMTKDQMGELMVTPATVTSTCTGAANKAHTVTGTAGNDCGRASFIARYSKDGKALYLNKLEIGGGLEQSQAVITDSSFDTSNSQLYVIGYFTDGRLDRRDLITLKAYDIDPVTRVSKATASGQLAAAGLEATNHVYQEGFLLKYSRAGSLIWMRSIKGLRVSEKSGLLVSQLRVKVYKASTSSAINTARRGEDNAPTLPTHTSRRDIEFDTGKARGAVQGGTGKESSITLKALASPTHHWYNGLTIRITRGKGYGQTRKIFEYDGATKIARVMPRWDPHDIPEAGSSYVIEGGRPSSWISGTHWTNGGVYVTAAVQTVCGPDCHTAGNKTAISLRIGEMNAVYRDSNAPTTAKYVDVSLGQDDHQNFLAQFDVEGKVYWARFVGVNGIAGDVPHGNSTLDSLLIKGSYGEFGGPASTIDDFYVGSTITIIAGNNEGRSRLVTRYQASSRNVTVSPPFPVGCDGNTRFIISNRGTVATIASATATSVTLPATLGLRAELDGAFVGKSIIITKGTGIGQFATIQAYDGSTRSATITAWSGASAQADATSQVHILDSTSIEGIAVMQDAVFLTGGVTTSNTRVQNCTFDSATVTEGPPENTHPITVFECAVIGALPPVPSAARSPTWGNGAAKTEFAIAGSSSTDLTFEALHASTTWGMYTLAYNGSGSLMWSHVTHGGAIFPKAILAMDPSIGGSPLAGKWGGTVNSRSVPSRSQPPDATSAQDVGSLGLDSTVVDGPYIYVAAEISDWQNASDFGRTRLPLECSHGKVIGAKSAPTTRLADTPCAGQVVAKGTHASWPKASSRSTDIVLAQFLASNGEVQQLRRTGQSDKSETVTSLAGHALTGAVYLSGEYFTSGVSASTQGGEANGGGEDVFGLASAGRADTVGCPRQRWNGDEALGEVGTPDCRLYGNAPSATLPTGFVAKYTFNGDGATGYRAQVPSITGYLEKSSTWAPCTGAQDTNGDKHVLTGSDLCSTHVSGCSCLKVAFQSRTFASTAVDSDSSTSQYGPGPLSKLSGYRIRIVGGKSEGYEGIISGYSIGLKLYNVIPSIPATGIDETSVFQLFPNSRYTPRLHLPTCDAAGDKGCSAYGIEWAKTVGYSIGGGDQSTAQSSGVALAEMDSDVYIAGHYSGFNGLWPGFTGPSRNVAPAGGSADVEKQPPRRWAGPSSPNFGVEGVDELKGFTTTGSTVGTFLSKLTD